MSDTEGQAMSGLKKNLAKNLMAMPEFSVFMALVVMVIIMCFGSPYFLRTANIMNVLSQVARYGIIAVGMSLIIISGGIDLSVGYIVGFTACLCGVFSSRLGLPWPVVLIMTLGVGAIIGVFNGVLITRVGLVPFIVTMASMKMLGGATLLVTQGMPVTFSSKLAWLGSGYVGRVPVCVIIMFVVMFLGSVFARYTQTGRNLYAIGNNERAATLSGINTRRLRMLTYVITGVLSALVGIIVAGNLSMADASLGIGYEMDIIAGAVIGGIAMSGGEGHIWGSLIGVTIIGILKNAFVLLGVSSYWQSIVIGIVIIAAVTVDVVRGRTHLGKMLR
jgi:ribose transport system permease protein